MGSKKPKPSKARGRKTTDRSAKAPAKKAAAKKASATGKKASAGTKKPAKKAAAPRPAQKPAPRGIPKVESAIADDHGSISEATAASADVDKKPSALARLKTGVGKLFARVTKREQGSDAGEPPPGDTLEIVTGDIIAQSDAEPVKGTGSKKRRAQIAAASGRRSDPSPAPAGDEEDAG